MQRSREGASQTSRQNGSSPAMRSAAGGSSNSTSSTGVNGGKPNGAATRETIKLSLDQWSTQLAPLSDADRASVAALGDWLDRAKGAAARRPSLRQAQAEAGDKSAAQVPKSGAEAASSGEANEKAAKASSSALREGPRIPREALRDEAAETAWLASIEQHLMQVAESSHSAALDEVRASRQAIDAILEDIERAAVHVSELRAGCQYVAEGTSALRDEAEGHLERMDRLNELAEGLALRRSYFALLPSITRFLSTPSPDLALVLQPDFLHNLDRLDVALAFVHAHPAYRDAALYRMRFEQCIIRACSLVRMWLQRWAAEWTARTQEGLKTWQSNRLKKGKEKERPQWAEELDPKLELAEPVLQSLFFDPEINETPQLRVLLVELEKRSKAGPVSTTDGAAGNVQDPTHLPEIASILSECRASIFAARRTLLSGFVTASLVRLDAIHRVGGEATGSSSERQHQLLDFTQAIANFAVAVSADEQVLLEEMLDLRPEPEGPVQGRAQAEAHIAQLLGQPFLERLRPRLAAVAEWDSLAKACKTLSKISAPDTAEDVQHWLYRAALAPCLAECRQKMSSSVASAIKATIGEYKPTAEDLEYPEKLRKGAQAGLSAPGHRKAASSVGGAGLLGAALDAQAQAQSSSSSVKSTGQEEQPLFVLPSPEETETWYPPFRRAFDITAAMNDALNAEQLEATAIQAVRACLAALQRDAPRVGTTSDSNNVDSSLFLLRHVLLLRELLGSVSIAVQRHKQNEAASEPSSQSAADLGSTTLDLGTLVSALGAVWSTTGALLDPRRLYNGSSSSAAATQDPSSSAPNPLDTCAHLLDELVKELSVQVQQRFAHRALGTLGRLGGSSDDADKANAAAISKGFQSDLASTLKDAHEALSLYLADEAAIDALQAGIRKQVRDEYSRVRGALGPAEQADLRAAILDEKDSEQSLN